MRRLILAILTVALAIVVGAAAWRYLAAEDQVARLVLADVHGAVSVAHLGGTATEVAAGTALSPGDQVETGAEARATLQLSPGTRIKLGPTSSVAVRSVDREGVQLELEHGLLQATVRPESGAIRVGSRGREVVSTRGEFQVGVNDDVLRVATQSGEVSLVGVEPPIVIGAGDQVTVVGRAARAEPIPASVVLAVAWPPPDHRTRAETQTVEGTTDPGAEVTLEGPFGRRVVRADRTGHFRAEVPLAEGNNALTVVARDLLGREVESRGALPTRDTTGPTVRSE